MALFILTFIFVALAAAGMAVGVFLRGAELKGTCATINGSNHAGIKCLVCPNRNSCRARRQRRSD